MYPGIQKQRAKAIENGSEYHWKETQALRNLISYCRSYISLEPGFVKVDFKGEVFESTSEIRAIEWILNLRWNVKVHISRMRPLTWEKMAECGPILSSERKALKPPSQRRELDPSLRYPIELSVQERAFLLAEMERSIEYPGCDDDKRHAMNIKDKLEQGIWNKADGTL